MSFSWYDLIGQHNDKWALISLKPQPIQKDISSLLSECDKLLFEAGFCP